MPDLRATVVVVNWNGAHLLPACLTALRRQSVPDFQTWVVDNASTDDSRNLLAREYPEVRVLANADNRGFAGGNNTALRQVTTPYAVLLNNDAAPEPDWLEQLLAPFDEPGNDRLGAVSSKVVFSPRFVRLELATPGFRPGGADPRELASGIAAGNELLDRYLQESPARPSVARRIWCSGMLQVMLGASLLWALLLLWPYVDAIRRSIVGH